MLPVMRPIRFSPLAAALALLAACSPGAPLVPPGPAPSPAPSLNAALDSAYQAAIHDAAVYRPEHVRHLNAARPDARGRIRAGTLTTDTMAPGARVVTRDVWVTLVPEVRDSCLSWNETDADSIHLRLRQLIGLPPTLPIPYMMELSVDTAHVFRPAGDPTITSALPCPDTVAAARCGDGFPPGVSPAHVRWIADGTFALWKRPRGFPWTRLGYTYNWRPGAPRYGASEYIVRAGSPVEVLRSWRSEDYCRR